MLKKFVLLVFLILIGACTTPIAPPPKEDVPIKVVGAPIEIALTGIGSSKLNATVQQARVRPLALGTDVTNRIILGDAIIRSSTDVVPLNQARTTGHRYLHVTLPITVLESSFTNLTFMAMNDPKSGSPSAVSEMSRYPGLAAYSQAEFDALANRIEPTSPVMLEPLSQNLALVAGEEDTLQIYTESEVSSLNNTLPFGFVAHNGKSRTISNIQRVRSPDGTITIAMRVPLQALAKDDPYTIKLRFGIYEDDTTFITESLQAQQANNQVRFRAAQIRVGGSLRVMPGTTKSTSAPLYLYSSPQVGGNLRVAPNQTPLAICQVRTVGTAVSPTAYLVNRIPTLVEVQTRVIAMGQTLPLEKTISDTTGEFYLPTQVTLTDSSLGSLRGDELTAFGAGATTLNTSVCGLTASSPLTVLNIVKPVAGGLTHSLAIKSDGTVAAWGSNNLGQTNVPNGLTDVIAVASHLSEHNLALKQNGTVTAWGWNNLGQATVPNDLADVVAIATGYKHSLALKSNGTVVAWGGNDDLQTNVPSDLTNVVAIRGGSNHSLALKSDGTVKIWGLLNQITDIPSGLGNVIDISTGFNHSFALKTDGTMIAWGVIGQSSIPNGLSNVIAISAGPYSSFALKADGTMVAWGFGETTVPSDLTDVVAIAAGGYHSLALKADGSLVNWGNPANNLLTIPVIAPLIFQVP